MSLPILYSLRRCPYAMRARMGLILAKQPVLLRDIVTRNKPQELLDASPKGTVPVLVLSNGQVIEQSLDIMRWALQLNDPANLLRSEQPELAGSIQQLIALNDQKFIPNLEQYRASMRYHNDDQVQRREACESFIRPLEEKLRNHTYLFGDTPSQADFALMPFISQFARVDKKWFVQSSYVNLGKWLKAHYESPLYTKVMKQYPQWIETKEEFLFE
ncbi:glutathione S-transferase [Vibrio sp. T187]|uniref:glutathione S-transferase n=1 Tax=Vibrio TaxID=662 RepID=UPI0010C95A19|nr:MULTISPECIES: glutathione S-transferase [Vibrio]MBW3696042.1 glutathione S-transferase [Vibrio sp. T187]